VKARGCAGRMYGEATAAKSCSISDWGKGRELPAQSVKPTERVGATRGRKRLVVVHTGRNRPVRMGNRNHPVTIVAGQSYPKEHWFTLEKLGRFNSSSSD
jgi:hypothetical protein